MTLKEKILNKFPFTNTEYIREYEQIADDFAIGFAEWLGEREYNMNCDGMWNDGYSKKYWINELLEIYKKEKSANCNCEIPQPKGKCSENGIDVYCNKCGKSYSNQ